MKKFYISALVVVVIVALLCGGCVMVTRSTQSDIALENREKAECDLMPLSGVPYMLEVAPGVQFKFDTGADCSVLNVKDAERLRELGYEVNESFGPMMGRDGFGDYNCSLKRYTVTLPIGGYGVEIDSTGHESLKYSGAPSAVLRNVDFLPTEDGISTLGIDVLSKFKVECVYRLGAVVFHDELPSGYNKFVDMQRNIHLTDFLWSPIRSYIIVSVNQHPNLYLIDTGLQRAAIKKPSSQTRVNKHTLRRDTIHTMHHAYEAFVDDEAWVDCGTRSGTKKVFYYENSEDDYQINPLNVFQQDMVIDFENSGIYFRPTALSCRTR